MPAVIRAGGHDAAAERQPDHHEFGSFGAVRPSLPTGTDCPARFNSG